MSLAPHNALGTCIFPVESLLVVIANVYANDAKIHTTFVFLPAFEPIMKLHTNQTMKCKGRIPEKDLPMSP